MALDRLDWLLLFLSREPLAPVEREALDPIRIQKGMFLLSMRGPARNLYPFRPYVWGPFSPEIYSDLEVLEMKGLIHGEEAPGQTWHLYRTTDEGEQLATDLAQEAGETAVTWLAQARQFVSERPFGKLLRDIYAAYPDYATRTLLR